MVVSVHILDAGPRRATSLLRRSPRPERVSGLAYAEAVTTAPLGKRLLPSPQPGRVGLIASWEEDAALDAFLAEDEAGQRFAAGWHVRLEPIRVSGAWPQMPGLPQEALPVDEEEPVAVLTLGRLRLIRGLDFLRTAAAAEAEVVDDPALLASSGLARPPHLVSTFSLWRSAAAMKDYSYRAAGSHQAAVKADRAKPFHHASAFVRFRPYASHGEWDGRDPLSGLVGARA
jgi:hypothetical protein